MSDTIAAIATPGQPSAIGILRLSGPDTCAALDAVFRAKNGRPAAQQRPRTMVLGELLDETGQVIDMRSLNRFLRMFPAKTGSWVSAVTKFCSVLRTSPPALWVNLACTDW